MEAAHLARIEEMELRLGRVEERLQANQQISELGGLERLMARAGGVEKLIELGSIPQAEIEARRLYIESLQYIGEKRTDLFNKQNRSTYIPSIPIQAALKCVAIVSKPEIQFNDDLKYQMSKVCAVFLEHSLLVIEHNKRMIYPSIRNQLWINLSEVLGFVPQAGQRTRFELKCCLGAIHRMIPIGERLEAVAEERGPEIGKGVLAAGASLSAGPLVAPVVDALVATFKELPSQWYHEVFEIKEKYWRSLHENGRVPPTSKLVKSRQAVCVAQIFDRIIHDPQSPEALKQRVFNGRDENNAFDQDIVSLSQCKRYWKARFFSIKTLIELVPRLNTRQLHQEPILENQVANAIHALADALISERKKKIHDLIYCAYQVSTAANKLVWRHRVLHQHNKKLLDERNARDEERMEFLQRQIDQLQGAVRAINNRLKGEIDETMRVERGNDVMLGEIISMPEEEREEEAGMLKLHHTTGRVGMTESEMQEAASELLESEKEKMEGGAEEDPISEKEKMEEEEVESASIELLKQELLEAEKRLLEAQLKAREEELADITGMRQSLHEVRDYKEQSVNLGTVL